LESFIVVLSVVEEVAIDEPARMEDFSEAHETHSDQGLLPMSELAVFEHFSYLIVCDVPHRLQDGDAEVAYDPRLLCEVVAGVERLSVFVFAYVVRRKHHEYYKESVTNYCML